MSNDVVEVTTTHVRVYMHMYNYCELFIGYVFNFFLESRGILFLLYFLNFSSSLSLSLSLCVALYDQPLIIEGKRKRRSVELFAFTPSNREQVKSTADVRHLSLSLSLPLSLPSSPSLLIIIINHRYNVCHECLSIVLSLSLSLSLSPSPSSSIKVVMVLSLVTLPLVSSHRLYCHNM